MTDRQIPMRNYLPPHLVSMPFVSMREFIETYPPRTPQEVMNAWKRIAEEDRADDQTNM